MECCVIHDGRATLTPSLSRNIWLAVLIMANIDAAVDAADTQKNDTPTAQHVCYGVHGGAIKHLKGAAAFELQEESKDRKYRFVVKRLMANQRQGDEPPGLQILCGDADDFKKVQAQVDVVSPVGVCADDGDGGGDDEGDGGGGGRGRNKGGVVAVVVAIDG